MESQVQTSSTEIQHDLRIAQVVTMDLASQNRQRDAVIERLAEGQRLSWSNVQELARAEAMIDLLARVEYVTKPGMTLEGRWAEAVKVLVERVVEELVDYGESHSTSQWANALGYEEREAKRKFVQMFRNV